jgi:hypothetical protein
MLVSPFFKDKESAKRLFSCIKGWNYLKTKDEDNNVRISVILEDENTYTVYMYPSAERDVIVDFKNENLREEREQQLLLIQIMFCKQFDLKGSSLLKFKDIYKNGSPYIFQPYLYTSGDAEPIKELGHILKFNIKIIERSKLTKADPEFEHGKFILTKRK